MTDTLSKEARSALMSKVRSSDTKPEWILRCGLHRLGLRYNLKNNRLPGKPDLVFPKYRTAVFIHGCFWHRHPGCKHATTPKSNREFWEDKFSKNVQRDARNVEALQAQGWKVVVVWECQLIRNTVETVEQVAQAIRGSLQAPSSSQYPRLDLDRKELLTVAEEKVRYRIDKLDK